MTHSPKQLAAEVYDVSVPNLIWGIYIEKHGRYHRIVVLKIEASLIKHWREYQYLTG